jgi:hypothetical protein
MRKGQPIRILRKVKFYLNLVLSKLNISLFAQPVVKKL